MFPLSINVEFGIFFFGKMDLRVDSCFRSNGLNVTKDTVDGVDSVSLADSRQVDIF